MSPTVSKVKKQAGIAGQFAVTAEVTYEGEAPETITFVGSTYGGPVVMVTPAGTQTFVSEPGRFGPFGTKWVEKFFAPREAF
ncbi:MAG: hypothetical protein NVS3B1_27980 [Marmoricola sp.]